MEICACSRLAPGRSRSAGGICALGIVCPSKRASLAHEIVQKHSVGCSLRFARSRREVSDLILKSRKRVTDPDSVYYGTNDQKSEECSTNIDL